MACTIFAIFREGVLKGTCLPCTVVASGSSAYFELVKMSGSCQACVNLLGRLSDVLLLCSCGHSYACTLASLVVDRFLAAILCSDGLLRSDHSVGIERWTVDIAMLSLTLVRAQTSKQRPRKSCVAIVRHCFASCVLAVVGKHTQLTSCCILDFKHRSVSYQLFDLSPLAAAGASTRSTA